MTSVLTNTSQSDVCQNVGALKSTDVGEIPVDWQVVEAGDIGRFKGGSGFPLTYQGQQHGEHPFFKVSDMSSPDNTIALKRAIHYISDNARRALGAYLFPKNTIVFAKVGAAIFLERRRMLEQPSCIDNNMAGFVVSSPNVEFSYIYHFLTSYKLGSLVSVTALPSLNGGVLKRIKVPLPPKAEQALVAEALDDADALIESLEQLIAKKRAVKQGAMQDLLSGRRRLPGFSGDWTVVRLGDIGETFGGLTGKNKGDFGQGNSRYITFMNVINNVVVRPELFDYVAVKSGESQNKVLRGDLLFNGSSETPEEVGMCSLLAEDVEDVYLNSFCFGYRLKDALRANGLYLAYFFRSGSGRELLKSLAQGATRYNLSKRALLKVEFRLPAYSEQCDIAKVLSEIDEELAELQAKLAKARQLKQGMMQELLTGRVRLV